MLFFLFFSITWKMSEKFKQLWFVYIRQWEQSLTKHKKKNKIKPNKISKNTLTDIDKQVPT